LHLGLRVGGVGAQQTGRTFGCGVYFADLFSKSWDYSFDPENPEGARYVLLCEVALGKVRYVRSFQDLDQANLAGEASFDSLKAIGRIGPDPKRNVVTADGLNVPMG